MGLIVNRVGSTFAARIEGVKLSQPLSGQTIDEIEQALADHGVLHFPDQPLTDEQQEEMIRRFGPPIAADLKELKDPAQTHRHLLDIATIDGQGKPIAAESARGMYLLANQLWHTDGTQMQPPLRLTALSARVLPPEPPPTEYADMRAAWDALPASRQRELEPLKVRHSILWSRSLIGMKPEDFSEETRNSRPPVVHPLVRTHARTGRKSLYLASHAWDVVGWPFEQGRALLDELTQHATQRRFVYVHHWNKNDLVMWDDSWTMHRAMPYKAPHPRVMRWCGVAELKPV